MGTFLSGVATIFYRLVDHSIEISVLICLIFCVKWMAGKKLPPWWHYSLWLMLLIRMLVPIEFENRLNVYNFIPNISEHQVFEIITDSPFEDGTSAAEFTSIPPKNRPNWRYLLKNSVSVLWLFGAMAFGIFILFKSTSFWRNVRRIPPIVDKGVLNLLAQCKNRMKIKAEIDVIVTDKVRSPALFGYFHPRLLLPKGIFEKLGDEDLSYAFMHELGHLKRRDIGVSWIMAVLQVVYWFNPLVWVAFYHVRIDQESACDESVLSRIKGHQSKDYAKAIVGFLEKFYQNCQLPSLAGVMENKTQMKRRIANIVHYKKYSHKLKAMAFTLFISTGFVLYLFTGVAEVKQTQSTMEQDLEKPLLADTKSFVDGEHIVNAEIIPSGFSPAQTDVSSKPIHSAPGYTPRPTAEAENIKEASPENPIVSADNETSSQIRPKAADETIHVVRGRKAIEEKPFSSDTVPSYEADNYIDTGRVIKKNAELSLDPGQGHRTVKINAPDVMKTASMPEAEVDKEQPEEKRTSYLMAAVKAESPGSVSPGSFPVKPDKEFVEKRSIEPGHDASMPETNPGKSGQQTLLWVQEESIVPGSREENADKHSKTAVSNADDRMMAGNDTEKLMTSDTYLAIEKADRGKDGDNAAFLVSDVDMPPKVIRADFPQYPYKAKRNKITGYIKIRFTVTKDGDAVDTTVVESKPRGVFDRSALEALESYRFKPGMKDGKAVDVQVTLPIKYI